MHAGLKKQLEQEGSELEDPSSPAHVRGSGCPQAVDVGELLALTAPFFHRKA